MKIRSKSRYSRTSSAFIFSPACHPCLGINYYTRYTLRKSFNFWRTCSTCFVGGLPALHHRTFELHVVVDLVTDWLARAWGLGLNFIHILRARCDKEWKFWTQQAAYISVTCLTVVVAVVVGRKKNEFPPSDEWVRMAKGRVLFEWGGRREFELVRWVRCLALVLPSLHYLFVRRWCLMLFGFLNYEFEHYFEGIMVWEY